MDRFSDAGLLIEHRENVWERRADDKTIIVEGIDGSLTAVPACVGGEGEGKG